ncbi:vWA domain-containing protein [Solibacillus sp. NPDC093137]|uniref:vWA domain-containing protein n=1 Tax=Solibacillus sp. NPDC093137 TaxID=3390678 RepID=UPI003D0890AC
MTNEYKTVLTDEILHFLYRNASFQALDENQQQQFLEKFGQQPLFIEVIEIAIAVEEMIAEVEATMPKIQDKDYLFPIEQQKQLLKDRMVIDGNVLYVSFDEMKNRYSPMIVIVQQSDAMQEYEAFTKGTILPLFNLCAVQKRDLIILPFSNKPAQPLLFKNGKIDIELFDQFLQQYLPGDAQIIPAIDKAIEFFTQDNIDNQRDLMIITDNQFTDFHKFEQQVTAGKMQELDIDLAVIAMSETNFESQPIAFADKVFFAND